MKTPREILFERYRAAETKLDAISEQALAELDKRRTEYSTLQSCRNLLLSFRWHLAGLSAAWLVVLLLSTDHSATTVSSQAEKKLPSAQQLMASVHENRRQVRELTGTTAVDIEPSHSGPHSSLRGFLTPWEQSQVIINEAIKTAVSV